jgi:ABC-type Fe3+ transport system permease subunit
LSLLLLFTAAHPTFQTSSHVLLVVTIAAAAATAAAGRRRRRRRRRHLCMAQRQSQQAARHRKRRQVDWGVVPASKPTVTFLVGTVLIRGFAVTQAAHHCPHHC